MDNYRILLVEDEILIADTIKRYLTRQGHEVVGNAISYEEATEIYNNENPDLTLLDIRLSGSKTGIDVAHFIQNQTNPSPYIFLTSQLDTRSINSARETFPAGYLTKPIQKNTLFTTIEMAMFKHQATRQEEPSIQLNDGSKNYKIKVNNILYLQADHIYVKVFLSENNCIVLRSSLKDILSQLPDNQFIQAHRSYAINLEKVTVWDSQKVIINQQNIPLSRSKKGEVLQRLNEMYKI